MSLTMDHMKRSSYLRRFTVTALITLLMIIMGSTTASAVSRKTLVYGRAVTAEGYAGIPAWSAADIGTDGWGGNAWLNGTHGVYIDGGGNRTTSHTFTFTEDAVLELDIEWFLGGNTGDGGNYSSLKIGDNIEISQNQQNQWGKVSINGVESNVANACVKNNNRNDDIWKIHIEINTASNKLVAFSIRGTNGTNKASYTLAQETTLNTDISTSLVATMSFVRVKNSPYTGLHSIALYEVTDVEKNTVTYTKGNDNDVYGGSYTEEISSGQEFTCAANTFVYKSGSTLKNWVNSNDAIYNVGTQYDIYIMI